jgi:TonB family protein
LVLERLPNDLLSQFGDEQIIEIFADGVHPVRLALSDTTAAMTTLEACKDDLLTSWGMDVARLHALRSLPEPTGNPGRWVTFRDYPIEAVRHGIGGTVIFKLDVTARGEVADCTILESSGYPTLDSRTCRRLRERARFEPATDADGRPVPAPWVNIVTFWTP